MGFSQARIRSGSVWTILWFRNLAIDFGAAGHARTATFASGRRIYAARKMLRNLNMKPSIDERYRISIDPLLVNRSATESFRHVPWHRGGSRTLLDFPYRMI